MIHHKCLKDSYDTLILGKNGNTDFFFYYHYPNGIIYDVVSLV